MSVWRVCGFRGVSASKAICTLCYWIKIQPGSLTKPNMLSFYLHANTHTMQDRLLKNKINSKYALNWQTYKSAQHYYLEDQHCWHCSFQNKLEGNGFDDMRDEVMDELPFIYARKRPTYLDNYRRLHCCIHIFPPDPHSIKLLSLFSVNVPNIISFSRNVICMLGKGYNIFFSSVISSFVFYVNF
jgi:hypothetical protein